jgi:fucose permease
MTPDNASFDRGRLFLSACGALFVFGVLLVLLGTLFGMPEMRERLQVTDMVRQGDLQTLLLFGVFLATVVAGPVIDRFGNKLTLAVSSLLATVGMIGMGAAHSYAAAQISGFVLGLGGGGLNVSANVLTSSLFADDRGAKLNLLAVFFGVGAMFLAFAAAAVEAARMPLVIFIAAAVSAVCLVAFLLLRFPREGGSSGFSLPQAAKVVRYPGVLLFAFLLFFESGNEAAFIGWTSTWAGGMAANVRQATLVLALFQAMMMLGRISASRVLRVISEEQLVLGSAVGALAATLIVALAPSAPVLAIGVALGGLACASIYPSVLAIAGNRYRSFAGTLFGVLFAVGLSGGMVFPWTIGHLSQSLGLRAGMAMPLAGAVAICVFLLVIRARGGEPAAISPQTMEADD